MRETWTDGALRVNVSEPASDSAAWMLDIASTSCRGCVCVGVCVCVCVGVCEERGNE